MRAGSAYRRGQLSANDSYAEDEGIKERAAWLTSV